MTTLFEALAEPVALRRSEGYPHEAYPAIAEILEWAGETEEGELRYLRRPQLRALETYWYLRLVEETPQTGVVEPRIADWRAMVDCVMIDASYDGEVFDITLSDVPERKTDLISGEYELPAPKGKTTIAVKIVDMLGEEVLETARV